MTEQIRARIRGARRGRRSARGRAPFFATLGSLSGAQTAPHPGTTLEVAAERPATDSVDVITSLFGILQGLFLVRVALALISVAPAVPVAAAVHALSDPLVAPFLFAAHVGPATSAMPSLDAPALLAFVVWTLVETACIAAICVLDHRRSAGDPASGPRILAVVGRAGHPTSD